MAPVSLTIVLSPKDRSPVTADDWANALAILSSVMRGSSKRQAAHGNDPFEFTNAATGQRRRYDMSWATNQ